MTRAFLMLILLVVIGGAIVAAIQPNAELAVPESVHEIVWSEQSFVDCAAAEEFLASVRDQAYDCEADGDCQFYECNTRAIGRGAAAESYIAADKWFVRHCDRERLRGLGYASMPVCENGKCAVRVIE